MDVLAKVQEYTDEWHDQIPLLLERLTLFATNEMANILLLTSEPPATIDDWVEALVRLNLSATESAIDEFRAAIRPELEKLLADHSLPGSPVTWGRLLEKAVLYLCPLEIDEWLEFLTLDPIARLNREYPDTGFVEAMIRPSAEQRLIRYDLSGDDETLGLARQLSWIFQSLVSAVIEIPTGEQVETFARMHRLEPPPDGTVDFFNLAVMLMNHPVFTGMTQGVPGTRPELVSTIAQSLPALPDYVFLFEVDANGEFVRLIAATDSGIHSELPNHTVADGSRNDAGKGIGKQNVATPILGRTLTGPPCPPLSESSEKDPPPPVPLQSLTSVEQDVVDQLKRAGGNLAVQNLKAATSANLYRKDKSNTTVLDRLETGGLIARRHGAGVTLLPYGYSHCTKNVPKRT
ncbi:MAG: hypothetical protein ABGZ53_28130 [Fuerstiella sp.]